MVTESPYDVFLQLTEHTETNCSTCKNNKELNSQSFTSEVLSVMIKQGDLNGYVLLKESSHPQYRLCADCASHCSFNNYLYKLYIF